MLLLDMISTHAPRTGSDHQEASCFSPTWHFNPRSPHGERREPMISLFGAFVFQPTLPARGATRWGFAVHPRSAFQPTLPARGATASATTLCVP